MKKLYSLFILVLSLTSCGSNVPDDIKYEIIKEKTHSAGMNCNVWIRLNKPVEEKILKEIATELRNDRGGYNNLFLFYYLPGMNEESMAWAISHYTPELEIEFLDQYKK